MISSLSTILILTLMNYHQKSIHQSTNFTNTKGLQFYKMTDQLDSKTSLLITQLNNKMLDLLCLALLKNNGSFITNQTEVHKKELKLETLLDGFDSNLIIVSYSQKDTFNRIIFTLSFLTYNSKHIATLEMIFNQNNLYEEGSFSSNNKELITQKFLDFLSKNKFKIIENIF